MSTLALDTITFQVPAQVKIKAIKQLENMGLNISDAFSGLLSYAVKTKDWLWVEKIEDVAPVPYTRERADAQVAWAMKYGRKFKAGEDVLADLLR